MCIIIIFKGICQSTLTGHSSLVYSLFQLMDGKIISGSNDKTLKMWNVNAPKRKEDNVKEAEKELGQSKSKVEVINLKKKLYNMNVLNNITFY